VIIHDTFDPDNPSPPVDWTTMPLPLLVGEARDGDRDALVELCKRSGEPVPADLARYKATQPRDRTGKWTHGGGGGAAAASGGGGKAPLTDAEYEAHTAMIESKVAAELARGGTTDAMYSIDGKGRVYTPERAKMHQEIVDEVWRGAANVPNEGKAILAGGLGGAGKTTILGQHAGIPRDKYLTLNPDDIKETMARKGMVPKVEGLAPMEAATLAHGEATHITDMIATRAYAEKKNIIWDVTMRGGGVDSWVQDLRGKGYREVRGVFVDIPVETSVQRALSRHRQGLEEYRNGKGMGGRWIPPAISRGNVDPVYGSKNRRSFEEAKGAFDNWQMWDNSVLGRPPQRLGSG
jgi:hypothetical protein